ncbi:MAG: hypothetical protein HYV97_07605 [Bdellovibrio sp.]|nr:hypothetical protein [Bdellovibrio sp.]
MGRDDFHQRARRHQRRRHKHGRPHANRNAQVMSGQNKMNFDEVVQRYEKLMETHLDARRKYFEYYYRNDDRERNRLEDNFYRTLREWRHFEDNLPEPQRILLEKKYDSLDLDMDFSEINQLNSEDEEENDHIPIDEGPYPHPHITEGQKQVSYKSDTEESIGNMDDYKKYKGL